MGHPEVDGSSKIPERLQDRAGRWAPGSKSRKGYVEELDSSRGLAAAELAI